MKPFKFQGHNKGAVISVESAVTEHNLLFYVRTLWLNNLTLFSRGGGAHIVLALT